RYPSLALATVEDPGLGDPPRGAGLVPFPPDRSAGVRVVGALGAAADMGERRDQRAGEVASTWRCVLRCRSVRGRLYADGLATRRARRPRHVLRARSGSPRR